MNRRKQDHRAVPLDRHKIPARGGVGVAELGTNTYTGDWVESGTPLGSDSCLSPATNPPVVPGPSVWPCGVMSYSHPMKWTFTFFTHCCYPCLINVLFLPLEVLLSFLGHKGLEGTLLRRLSASTRKLWCGTYARPHVSKNRRQRHPFSNPLPHG